MKIPASNPMLSALLALYLALIPSLRAQEAPATPPSESAAATPAPAAPEAPAADNADKSELRRLDVPPSEATPGAEPEVTKATEPETPAATSADADDSDDRPRRTRRHGVHHDGGNARITLWGDSKLGANESADAVVSVVGSSTSAGRVHDAVVSVLGSSTSSGEVGNAVVSVLGNTRVTGGSVGETAISVLGDTYVNGHVRGDVVAVLGNVELGPDAIVDGEINCVGGKVIQDSNAKLHGKVNHVAIGWDFTGFDGLQAWVTKCLAFGRPLAFGANLMWAWWIAIVFLALYMVLAAIFPKPTEKCIQTFEQKPGTSVITALVVLVLTPIAFVLLAFTIVGAPALVVFMLGAGLFGRMVMIAWIGRRITRMFGDERFNHPALAVLCGGIVVLGLYTVPVVGFITAKFISWVGLGVVISTIMNRPKQPRTVMAPVVPVVPVVAGNESAGFGAPSPAFAGTATPAAAPIAAGVPPLPVVSAVALPRAGFWIRIAASVLDCVIVGLAVGLLPHGFKPNFLLLYAAYCVVLWGLKGTTIGGIVCNLKVVRLDDRVVDWPTALVRGLAGFLSFFAAGIGFIWVAFDDQRQSWHDKIAGTTIVYVPKGVSLV